MTCCGCLKRASRLRYGVGTHFHGRFGHSASFGCLPMVRQIQKHPAIFIQAVGTPKLIKRAWRMWPTRLFDDWLYSYRSFSACISSVFHCDIPGQMVDLTSLEVVATVAITAAACSRWGLPWAALRLNGRNRGHRQGQGKIWEDDLWGKSRQTRPMGLRYCRSRSQRTWWWRLSLRMTWKR